tara:strand:+ start:1510 stop:2268 length:759 start_codon:yes stop_codon:yes gene_type:complete
MDITEVVKKNRKSLSGVDCFITDKDYNSSPDSYGLPYQVKHLIDLPINEEFTYVDILMFLQQHLQVEKIKYVEIGVSVLKTFYQVANFLEDSELYAFDINKVNPTIAEKFTLTEEGEKVNKYTHNNNKISHFKGNVFKQEDFDLFEKEVGGSVNVIFSDAHHTGEGLKAEYDSYINEALADDFILYYDDLQNPSMQQFFVEMCKQKKEKNPSLSTAFLKVNGWLGEHEAQHVNGIITSLNLRKIFPFINYLP